MKLAINVHRVGSAFRHESLGLTRHSQRKAQRLLSKKTPDSPPENSSGDLNRHRLDRASFGEAIRLAQQGDAEAFKTIYQQHCGRVYALCLRMLRDPVEAEDLAQEVFIQLFRKIHTFRGESAFSTWLHRLTANLVLMRLRRKKPVSISLDDISGSEEEDAKPRPEIGGPDPRLSGLIDRVNLQAAIDQLPEGYREIFILYDVHGYEHNEIAQILGRSIGNSKSQLHKARKRLRELLQGMPNLRATRGRKTPGCSRACRRLLASGRSPRKKNRTHHEK
jgi:RNA polymerase sigma-70 factor, ECF subfamily